MIKVLREQHEKTWQIECPNCGSLLEYSKADIYEGVKERKYVVPSYTQPDKRK